MIDMERLPERNIRLERFGMHDLSDSGQVVTCGLVITKKCLRWCATSSKVHGGKDREIQLNPPWQNTIDQKLPSLRCGLRLRLVNAEASRRNRSVVCCQTGVLVRCSAMSVDSTAGVSRAICLNGGGRRSTELDVSQGFADSSQARARVTAPLGNRAASGICVPSTSSAIRTLVGA